MHTRASQPISDISVHKRVQAGQPKAHTLIYFMPVALKYTNALFALFSR
jgi:hypothetical protein